MTDHRNVFITGASSGLGRGLATFFAKRGSRVFAAGRRKDKLTELQTEVHSAGGHLEPVVMDVDQPDEVLSVMRKLDADSGGLDLVIANAGVADDSNGKRLEWARVQRVIQTNVVGATATLAAVLPQMVERGRGQIVGVASLAAFRGLPRTGAYSASKAFLSVFLEGMRVDLRGTGVKVTCLYPGFVKSEMTEKNRFKMPFLLETYDAVERMGKAIVRGDAEFAFPWQLSVPVRALKVMPNALFDVVAKKLR